MFLSNSYTKTTCTVLVFFGFAVIFPSSFFSQLEVINGGFEEFEGLPSNSGMLFLTDNWTNAGSMTANPDYYHMDGIAGGDLPETPLATIDSYEGRAIVGLEVSRQSGQNKREYLTGMLSEPLEPGKKYEFSFAIANGDVHEHSAAGLGVSHLGVAFTNEPLIQYNREPINHHPNFYLNNVHYYQGWKVIRFVFTAVDSSEYFTFGMFGYDNGKMIESFEGPERLKAYYFLDNFSIRTISPFLQNDKFVNKGEPNETFGIATSTYVPTAFSPNGDNINDVFAPKIEKNCGATMYILNRAGNIIWHSSGSELEWDGRNQSGRLSNLGVYVWMLNINLEDGSVKELSGPVTLLQ